MSEDASWNKPAAAEAAAQRDEDDVEAHGVKPNVKPDAAATEEGPDVEAHNLKPNVKP